VLFPDLHHSWIRIRDGHLLFYFHLDIGYGYLRKGVLPSLKIRKSVEGKATSHNHFPFRPITYPLHGLDPQSMVGINPLCPRDLSAPKIKKPDTPFGAPGLFKFLTAELAKCLPCSAKCGNDSYIIPPMPWSWPWGSGASGSGMSLMRHSVVRRSPEIDAAFWRALRVTLVGSTTPPATRSS